jgi:hypothetical protein
MRVEIPALPPKETNPNWRGHWGARAKSVKEFRQMAFYCAVNRCFFEPIPLVKAEVEITLIIPDRRYCRDPDNLLASLKPAIDGCVDAGIILGDDDKHLQYKLPVMYQLNRAEAPKTILEFKEVK